MVLCIRSPDEMTQIITAIIGVLGVIVGAHLTRQRDHESWLHQRRSEVFTEFLQRVEESIEEAKRTTCQHTDIDRALELYPAFRRMLSYTNIVRLHLPPNRRGEFVRASNSIWAKYSYLGGHDEAVYDLYKALEELQIILEEAIKSPPFWFFSRRKDA